MFEGIADDLSAKVEADETSRRAGMSNAEILLNYLGQLYLADCVSQKELLWLGHRAAALIECEILNGRFYGLKDEGFRADDYTNYQLRVLKSCASRV